MTAPLQGPPPSRLFWPDARDLWKRITAQSNPELQRWLTGVTCVLVALIGLADFLLDIEVSLLVFYFIPIAVAVVARGWRFGLVIALVCVTTWIVGDLAGGAHYASPIVPVWNAIIACLTYLVLIALLSGLFALQRDLEERVRQRTAALSAEIAERERLEKAILEVSERERLRIGHDLHDGLGQHLTGTALTGQLLAERLQERAAEETADARRVVALVKAAIEQTRDMAKGLLLAEINAESLPDTLREFCATTTEQFRTPCIFHSVGHVSLPENGLATHLYRITQEAVRNAIRHGRADRIEVHLLARKHELILTICDNGSGLPPLPERGQGLGLRIMAHRASIIGARFAIETRPSGGCVVQCQLPLPAA